MSACAAVRPTFTLCPPMPARGAMTYKPQYRTQKLKPVHLPKHDADGNFENGLTFDDYSRCQTHTLLGGFGKRRCATPDWAMNDTSVRRVVLAFLERRCFSKRRVATIQGTERERLLAAICAIAAQKEGLIATYDRLDAEYVAHLSCTAEFCQARRKTLRRILEGLDTSIRLTSQPDAIYSIVVEYHRWHLSSVGVAERHGISPVAVRQILARINRTAAELGYAVEFSSRRTAEERERSKAERDAIREARRAEKRELAHANFLARQQRLQERDALRAEAVKRELSSTVTVAASDRLLVAPSEKQRKPRSSTHAVRRANGLCPDCGAKPDEGRSRCKPCAVLAAAYSRAARARKTLLTVTA